MKMSAVGSGLTGRPTDRKRMDYTSESNGFSIVAGTFQGCPGCSEEAGRFLTSMVDGG